MRSKIAALAVALALVSAMTSEIRADDAAARTAWDFSFTAIEGGPMPFSDFRGKVLLVVNTASFCGFTKQYKALQALHELRHGRGRPA